MLRHFNGPPPDPSSKTSSMKRHHTSRDDHIKATLLALQQDSLLQQSTGSSNSSGGRSDGTSNLFVGNIATSLNEKDIEKAFSCYGPLRSVKIMWPRLQTPTPTSHKGFVHFVNRGDAERALREINNQDVFSTNHNLQVCWSKPPAGKSDQSATIPKNEAANSWRELFSQSPSNKRQKTSSEQQQLTLEQQDLLREVCSNRLSCSKAAIGHATAFCYDHSFAAAHICKLLREEMLKALQQQEECDTQLYFDSILARLYLMSDILYNSQQPGVVNAFYFRDYIQSDLAAIIFAQLGTLELGRLTFYKLKGAIEQVLHAWDCWSVYPSQVLENMQACFDQKRVVTLEETTKKAGDMDLSTSIYNIERDQKLNYVGKAVDVASLTTKVDEDDDDDDQDDNDDDRSRGSDTIIQDALDRDADEDIDGESLGDEVIERVEQYVISNIPFGISEKAVSVENLDGEEWDDEDAVTSSPPDMKSDTSAPPVLCRVSDEVAKK